MPDAPTPWELRRALDDLRQDLRDTVSAQVLAATLTTFERRFAEVEKDIAQLVADRKADLEDRKAEAKQRAADRRWLIVLAVGMIAPLLMQLYQLTRGG